MTRKKFEYTAEQLEEIRLADIEYFKKDYLRKRMADVDMPTDKDKLDALWEWSQGRNELFNERKTKEAQVIARYPAPAED